METRTKHTYRTQLYEFAKDVLVECPNCAHQALVNTNGETVFKSEKVKVRVVCGHCGFNKYLEQLWAKSKHFLLGAAVDPFFHLPLWLKIELGDHLLWAYNHEHLRFVEEHVAAKLRERNGFQFQTRSIGARLPRWMTAAKRREEILRAIEKLRNKKA
ncbi:MAG: TFIIB-type zinc ribbon-containing protein [Saprospiraceae bacterium]|nr:TFIIB-type zinc ribbon-containing protein [Saprospiraceae bacterium]